MSRWKKVGGLCLLVAHIPVLQGVTRLLDTKGRCLTSYSDDQRLVVFEDRKQIEEKLSRHRRFSFEESEIAGDLEGKTVAVAEVCQKVWQEIVGKIKTMGEHSAEPKEVITKNVETALKQHLNDVIKLLTGLDPL